MNKLGKVIMNKEFRSRSIVSVLISWFRRFLTVPGGTMGKKLYVGNLPYSIDDSGLQQEFAKFGSVSSAKVITDRETGRSKGFGFVEMDSDDEANTAIEKMNGFQWVVARSTFLKLVHKLHVKVAAVVVVSAADAVAAVAVAVVSAVAVAVAAAVVSKICFST